MSAPHFPALNAIVFQLAATLDRYEQEVDALLDEWPDTRRYDAVRRHMDHVQMFSSSVPLIAGSAVALLIAHSELIFTLWRTDRGAKVEGNELDRARRGLRDRVAELRRQCLRELSRTGHPTPM